MGEAIATNLSWGGIRNIVPIPDVRVLTDEVVSAAQKFLAWHGAPIRIADAPTDLSDLPEDWLRPDDGIYELWERNKYPWRVDFELNAVQVGVDYRGLPTINPEVAKTVSVWLHNREPVPLTVTIAWDVPNDWQVEPMSSSVTIPAKGIVGINAHICAPSTCLKPKLYGCKLGFMRDLQRWRCLSHSSAKESGLSGKTVANGRQNGCLIVNCRWSDG